MQKFPKNGLKILMVLALITVTDLLSAQQAQMDDSLVKYTTEFKFRDGLYLNFDQVKENNPIFKSRIITDVAYDNPDFFSVILKEKKIQLFDHVGSKLEIASKNIWGYANNGVLYINFRDNYFRVTVIGSICHFVANVTTYHNDINPYMGYPYYNPYYSYYSPNRGSPDVELRQFLLDFKTGNLLEYNEESVQVLLMQDPELHDEYAGLNKKKQKQLKFVYIRKFNEKYPLYFPVN